MRVGTLYPFISSISYYYYFIEILLAYNVHYLPVCNAVILQFCTLCSVHHDRCSYYPSSYKVIITLLLFWNTKYKYVKLLDSVSKVTKSLLIFSAFFSQSMHQVKLKIPGTIRNEYQKMTSKQKKQSLKIKPLKNPWVKRKKT